MIIFVFLVIIDYWEVRVNSEKGSYFFLSLVAEMLNVSLVNPCAKTLNRSVPSKSRTEGYTQKRTRASSSFDLVLLSLRRRRLILRCSSGQAAGESFNSKSPNTQDQPSLNRGFWTKWKMNTAEMRARVAKLGLSAVLAYGLFDGITYTTFFVLAFLGYEKGTGKNPAANLQALLGIVILMWTGNNVTRPFRVAGAAAFAPFIDKGLKRIQKYFNLPSQIFAFALVVSIVAASCLTVVGLLILSRCGK